MRFSNFIKNYLYDKKYFICTFDDYIYLYNYNKIIELHNEYLLVSFDDFLCRINGENLVVKRLCDKELLLRGKIKKVLYE